MTTTVRVQARAWGASVVVSRATEGQEGHNVEDETADIGANQERAFHIQEGETVSFRVTHGEKPAENPVPFEGEEVPGRAENDRLVPPTGNESGATETAQTTDTPDEQPVSVPGGRLGSRARRDGDA